MNSLKKEQGIIAVEVAFLIPLVLLFFMAIIEVGFFFFYGYQFQEASYRGARYAASHWEDNSSGQNDIHNVVVYGTPVSSGRPLLPGLEQSEITVSFAGMGGTDSNDGHITVRVSYDYQPVFPLPGWLYPDIEAETIMRLL